MAAQVKSRHNDAAAFAPHKLWRSLRLYPVALAIAAALLVVVLVSFSSGSGSLSGSARSQRHQQPAGDTMSQPQPQPEPPPPRSLRIPVRRVPVDLYPQFAEARRARLAAPFFTRDRIAAPSPAASTQRRRLLQDLLQSSNSSSSSSSTAAASDSSSADAVSSSSSVAESSSADSSSAADESSSAASAESSAVSSSSTAESSSAFAAISSSSTGESSSAADSTASASSTAAPSSSSSATAASSSSTGSSPAGGLPMSTTAAGEHGRVHLRDYSDYMYIGVIGVGTPPQYFGCVFDTGSADTWVFSSSLPQSLHHPWLHYFNPAASSTFVPVGSDWRIAYGKGSAQGRVQSDSVWVGGMQVAGQHFGLATSADAATFSLANEPIDGLMGLGFQQLATAGFGPTLLENALNRGVIDRRAFVFRMGQSEEDPDAMDDARTGTLDEIATDRRDAAKHPGSYFQLGDPGSATAAAAAAAAPGSADPAPRGWVFTPIIPPHEVDGRWVVELGGLASDGKDVSEFCSARSGASKPCFAWVDTGSSFVLLPADRFEAIMGAIIARRPDCSISAREGTSVDQKVICTWGWTTYLLPTLSFRFGSGAATAADGSPTPEPEEFLLTPAQYTLSTTLVDSVTGAESHVLLLGFSPRLNQAAGYDEIILGDTFLKSYATLFDMGPRPAAGSAERDGLQGRIGFARGADIRVIGWALLLAVMAATCAVMAAGMAMVYRKHARILAAEAEAAAAAAGGGPAQGGHVLGSSLPSAAAAAAAAVGSAPVSNGRFGRSRPAAVLDDAGEGEARPRGYAQVSAVGGGADDDDSGALPLSPSGRRGDLESGSAASPSSSYDAVPLRSSDVELARLTAGAARPPSPSQLSRLSSDERAAMEEL